MSVDLKCGLCIEKPVGTCSYHCTDCQLDMCGLCSDVHEELCLGFGSDIDIDDEGPEGGGSIRA